jgi:hypothetical protein
MVPPEVGYGIDTAGVLLGSRRRAKVDERLAMNTRSRLRLFGLQRSSS